MPSDDSTGPSQPQIGLGWGWDWVAVADWAELSNLTIKHHFFKVENTQISSQPGHFFRFLKYENSFEIVVYSSIGPYAAILWYLPGKNKKNRFSIKILAIKIYNDSLWHFAIRKSKLAAYSHVGILMLMSKLLSFIVLYFPVQSVRAFRI